MIHEDRHPRSLLASRMADKAMDAYLLKFWQQRRHYYLLLGDAAGCVWAEERYLSIMRLSEMH